MSYSEFPHTNYSDHDHIELILMYQKLVDEYEGTLNEITEVSSRLDKYESDMNARILNIENVIVPQAVNRAVSEAMFAYQQEVNTQFNNLNNRVSTVEQMYDSIQSDIATEVSSLQNKIDELRTEVLSRDSTLQAQINNFNMQINNLAREMQEFERNLISEMNYFREEFKEDEAEHEQYVREMLRINQEDYILRDYEILANSKKYTDSKISALHTLIESLNLASNQKDIKWVWQYGCCFGGYDALLWYNETPITCEDWNKSKITCVDWYVRGREWFGWFDRRKFMFSPVSGKYVDVRVALLELATALEINGLTAEDYDKLGFTAKEYEAFKETAGEYDWNGRVLADYV